MSRSRFFYLIFIFLLFFSIPGNAQMQPDTTLNQDTLAVEDLEAALKFLENQSAVDSFTAQLRTIIAARKAIDTTQKDTSAVGVFTTNVFKRAEKLKNRYWSSLLALFEEIKRIPLSYEQVMDGITREEYRERLISFFLMVGLAFLIGVVVIFLIRKLAKLIPEVVSSDENEASIPAKIGSTLRLFLRSAAFWIGVFTILYAFTFLFPLPRDVESTITRIALSFLFYGLLKSAVGALASEGKPNTRLLPINDYNAKYLAKWTIRILQFSLIMIVLSTFAIGMQWRVFAAAADGIFKSGLAVMIAYIILRRRHIIKVPRIVSHQKDGPYWRNTLNMVLRYILMHLYIFIIVYLGVIILLSLLGYKNFYRYFLYSTFKSIGLALVASIVWVLWRLLNQRFSTMGTSMALRIPGLERHMKRNLMMLRKSGYVAIIFFSILFALEFWGIHMFEFFRSSGPVVQAFIHIVIIVVISGLLIEMSLIIVSRIQKEAASRMLSSGSNSAMEVEKRVSTLGGVLQKIVIGAIVIVAVMMVLDEIGLDIKAMLAGVGIVGLAVGFGAQNLVRDVISGLFVIFENRMRVGDVAIINGTGGLVEQVNLRTSVLRGLDGTIHVFPNGEITSLSNMTHEYSYYLFNIGVAYKEDTDNVVKVLKQVGEETMEDPEYKEAILEPIEILGVDQFADSSVIIKARIKTLPIKQWAVGREMNRRIKKRFDEVGIEIPFPHRSFYFGEASKPIRMQMEPGPELKDEVRKMVREIIQEDAGEV